jgi:hypothetical protein
MPLHLETAVRTIAAALALLMLGSAAVAQSLLSEAAGMEGEWGVSAEECADKDGPNFNMSVKWPWVHRYESHCKRTGMKQDGKSIVIEAACEMEGRKSRGAIRLTLIARETLAAEFVQGATGRARKEQYLFQRCSAS